MLYKSFYIGPEKFVKMFNFERRFSKDTLTKFVLIIHQTIQNCNISKL